MSYLLFSREEREKKNFVIATIDVSDNFFSVFGLLSSKKREKFPKSPNNLYVMFCAIWYDLYNLKNVKTPIKEAGPIKEACNFAGENTRKVAGF